MARELTVRWAPAFTMAIDALRRTEWLGGDHGDSHDEFDPISWHLTLSIEGELVAAVRTTVGPPSALQSWSEGRAPVPHGAGVAEITRGVVASSVRGLGLYSLTMLETVLRVRALGATSATAAIEPHFVGRRFLTGLGFVPKGDPVVFDDRPRRGTLVQCLALVVEPGAEGAWKASRETLVQRLTERGYHVDSGVPPASTTARVA
jgi:hypothetical protein